jgi:hypothetical protein
MLGFSIGLTLASLVVLILALIGRNIELKRELVEEQNRKLERAD